MLIEHVFALCPVEAFDKGNSDGVCQFGYAEIHFILLAPLWQCFTDQRWFIVCAHDFWPDDGTLDLLKPRQ